MIRLSHVAQHFMRHWVLWQIDLHIPSGATVLLTGSNGAGKTTLLRIMATLQQPSRGVMYLFGDDARVHKHDMRRRLALITHQHFFYDAISAQDNLRCVAELSGRACVPNLLEQVGLQAHQHKPVATFSAGMKKRLSLARLMLLQPEIVLLDEPFAQLDDTGVQLMQQTMQMFQDKGATLVVATHAQEQLHITCSHHIHLQAGRASMVAVT